MSWRDISLNLCAGVILALSSAAQASAAPDIRSQLSPLSSADKAYRSCKTLIQCVDILERHDTDSFDYVILARDFDRFGEPSREVLWRMIEAGLSGDLEAEILANRALDILSRSPKILPPHSQRRITELWTQKAGKPYKSEFLARIMTTNLSPLVRSTAIQTLDHPNDDVTYVSRLILAQTLQRGMTFPMPQADFAPLSRAALKDPSPTLAGLVALYPADMSAPLLARLLKSGDMPTVIAAYDALYKSDAEAAFKALVGTLYGLTPNDGKAAVGIGGLLAHRHPLREDGFYMNFASEVLTDPKMSEAGRAVGFDALLRRKGEKGVATLPNTPLSQQAYALALSAFSDSSIPSPYFDIPQMMEPQSPVDWLEPLQAAVSTASDKINLTEVAGTFNTPLAKDIAAKALNANGDYRLTVAGILASAAQSSTNDTNLSKRLKIIAQSHAFSLVKAAADLGIEAISSKSPRKTILKLQSSLPRRAAAIERRSAFCKIESTNLRGIARAMPFYDPAALPGRLPTNRAWLTTGARANGGWLAGYSRPASGGLVSYNNESGKGIELFEDSPFGPQAVIAVLPTTSVPLGQTAREFWIFASSLMTGKSAIYKARQQADRRFTLTQHQTLPDQPNAIKHLENGEVVFAMGATNPPLTLSANGQLRRSCTAAQQAEKPPS